MATGIKNLMVYQKSFELAMRIFFISKTFPREEKYSLTDQIRRSSRAVCANLAEAYAKRSYTAHFISKLTDSDMENNETQVWLEFAKECDYITQDKYEELTSLSMEVGRILNYMIHNTEKFQKLS